MVSGPIPFLGLKPNRYAPADETGIFALQLRRFVGRTVISIIVLFFYCRVFLIRCSTWDASGSFVVAGAVLILSRLQ